MRPAGTPESEPRSAQSAIRGSHPLAEFMSFGYPDSRSGSRLPQNLTTDATDATDDKDLLSASIRVIRGQAPQFGAPFPLF